MAYILCLIGGIGVAIVYAFQGFYSEFMYDFSNVAPPFIAGVAVASSFFALRRYWDYFGSRLSMIWLSFALGMLLWFLGEVGWAYYTMVVGIEVPYPSIADVFWLAGYLPLFLALLLYVELFQPAISVRLFLLAGAIVGIVSALVFSSLMIPVLASASELDVRRDSRRSRGRSCGRASRPRHISPAADRGGISSRQGPRRAPA